MLNIELGEQQLDLAFIDSSHDYESVKTNFERVVQSRMRKNGLVIFDDYDVLVTHPGVTHYLTRKAHDEGFVFYWFAPMGDRTSDVMFLNRPESMGYNWRDARV